MKSLLLTKVIIFAAAVLCSLTPAQAQEKLTGNASVSQTGAAVYSIPIEVPKGFGELKPSLSITYNSQSGNGLAGWGCNVTGISVITRSVMDECHEGQIWGIRYVDYDAYNLDGKRLLLSFGGSGQNNAEYCPDGDIRTVAVFHGSGSNIYFTVDTGDGLTYEYGTSADSRQTLSNPSAISAWYLKRITNTLGQTIVYNYTTEGMYQYPESITYGGNNAIYFEYETRPDAIPFVVRDQKSSISKRLKSITAKVGNNIYRKYSLFYDTTSDATTPKFSRLTEIKESGENGNSEHVLTADWNFLPAYSPTRNDLAVNFRSNYDDCYFLSTDVTGNGCEDLIQVSSVSNSYSDNHYLDIFKASKSGASVEYLRSPLQYRLFGMIANTSSVKGKIAYGDFDGDGIGDLFLPIYSTHNGNQSFFSIVYLYGKSIVNNDNEPDRDSTSVFINNLNDIPLYVLADFDNNSKTDIAILNRQMTGSFYECYLIKHNEPADTLYLSLPSTPGQLVSSDFNHDGLADIMVVCGNSSRIFYNHGGPYWDIFNNQTGNTSDNQLSSHDHMETGDFNGDGILDFVWNDTNSNGLYFELGNPNGTFTQQLAYTLDFASRQKNTDNNTWSWVVADLDHDGKSDIVLSAAKYYQVNPIINYYSYEKTYTYWFHSTGTSFTLEKTATSQREEDAKAGRLFVGDFKGEGFLDIANFGNDCRNGTNANSNPTLHSYTCSAQDISDGRISSMTDSDGRASQFTYASMSSTQVYTKGTNSNYPLITMSGPLCVVSGIDVSGGSPVSTQTHYTYGGLKFHGQGRGLLGFHEMTSSETYSGKSVTAVTDIDTNQSYLPIRTTVTTTQNSLSSTSVYTMTARLYGLHNYMLYPSTQKDTDIDGNITETTWEYNQDKCYLTKEHIEYGSDDMYKETVYSYGNQKIGGAWRPASVIEWQKHIDSNNAFCRRTDYTYNGYGLKTQIKHDYDVGKSLFKNYQYDNHGNVLQESISGTGITNLVVTNYEYDNSGKFLTGKSDGATTVSYTRNVFGDLTAETDMTDTNRPLTTTYTRNSFGTLTGSTSPLGISTTYAYAPATNYSSVYSVTTTTPGEPAVTIWYDTFGNETHRESTGVGGVAIIENKVYDEQGNLLTNTSQNGNLTITENFGYDGIGRQTSYTSSDGTAITYQYGDRTVTTTENGRTTVKDYDAWGNVTSITDPLSTVTEYTYHSCGKPASVTTDGIAITMDYDGDGNQTALNDPDAGSTSYVYDALHRITSQTDARGKTTTYTYDGAGRVTQKTIDGTTTSYQYATSGNGAGQLSSMQTGDCSMAYIYDQWGRITGETRTMTGISPLTFSYEYNDSNKISQITYPGNVTFNYRYDSNGFRTECRRNNTNVWKLLDNNGLQNNILLGSQDEEVNVGIEYPPIHPFDPIIDDSLVIGPNSITSGGRFFPGENDMTIIGPITYTCQRDNRGFMTSQSWHKEVGFSHTQSYTYEDGTGNLLSRNIGGVSESFTYDNLDRLTQVSRNNVTQQSISYQANGNISDKTGIGYYTYSNTHPHAVAGVVNSSGIIPFASQQATYTPFGKVQTLTEGDYSMSFVYGPDEERWKTVLTQNGNTVRTTIYAGNYERVTKNGTTYHYYYLDNGAVYVKKNNLANGNMYFAVTDHLGSILKLVNTSDTEVFTASYDAWGKQEVTKNTISFLRGYTGHEMLPEFGLINMNGRLYDPALGRFLSPDNYVQLPDFSQSFNRYSYCLNNPLKYTDPSGEFFGLDDAIIIGICIAGAANVWANWDDIQLDWGHGIASFFMGAGSAALGIVNPILGTAVLGASNSILNQSYNGGIDWGQVGFSMSMSLLTQGIGQKIGAIIDSSVSQLTSKVKNVVVGKWLNGAIDGTIGGFTLGTLFSLGNGENIGTSLENGGKNALQGFVIGSMNGLNQGYVDSRNQIKGTIPLREDVKQKFQKHAFSNGRLDNLGLNREEITERTVQLVEKHSNLLHDGQNNISLKIQSKPMILRVYVHDGTIYSINLMPNLSDSGYIRSSTPIINFPNQEW